MPGKIHVIASDRGDRMGTHEEYIANVERCIEAWRGKRGPGVGTQVMLLQARLNAHRDPKNCPVCQWHAKEGNHGA